MKNYNHKLFWDDLNSKSILGKIYQKYFLFPILLKNIKGELIDIGAGLGDFCKLYKKSVAADINKLAVENYKLRNIKGVLIKNNKIDIQDSYFDTSIMDNVIEHIENPEGILNEIKRILKNNGRLIIGVPGVKGFNNDFDHKVFYDQKSLTHLMSNFNFELEKVFHTPFKNNWLNNNLKAYTVYCVYNNIK